MERGSQKAMDSVDVTPPCIHHLQWIGVGDVLLHPLVTGFTDGDGFRWTLGFTVLIDGHSSNSTTQQPEHWNQGTVSLTNRVVQPCTPAVLIAKQCHSVVISQELEQKYTHVFEHFRGYREKTRFL